MPLCGKEIWIWTELLAFDNTSPDLGVEDYLQRVGHKPDGIALMLAHPDAVLLYEPVKEEKKLFPDLCSRHGHERNMFRHRQEWTNYQLRRLISLLHERGIKVFLSQFWHYLSNRFHHEWRSQIGAAENQFNMYDFLDDGTDLSDIFVPKLIGVMEDYGFDGWHAADGMGSGNVLATGGEAVIRQKLFEDFAKPIGIDKFPEEMRLIDNDDMLGRFRRSQFIWENYRYEWLEYITSRWIALFTKASDALHGIGRQFMKNTCWAKSVFESGYYFGLDMRRFSSVKLDYLMIETAATSAALVYGLDYYPERNHQIYAAVAELSAALPNTKVLSMTPVCDPVESFNSIRHVPTLIERDIYCCANQAIVGPNGEKQCVDGFLVCLGDSLYAEDWGNLMRYFKQTSDFERTTNEGYVWLYCDELYDNLYKNHTKYGTMPPYLQVCEMAWRGVMIPTVCRAENLDAVADRPLFVPDYDLLPPDVLKKVLNRKATTILMGNARNGLFPYLPGWLSTVTDITPGYALGMVVINGKEGRLWHEIPPVPQNFDTTKHIDCVKNPAPQMSVNEAFWDECAEVMKEQIFHPLQGQGYALITNMPGNGRRVAICSQAHAWDYFIPNFIIDDGKEHSFKLVSDYVCCDLSVVNGKLGSMKASGVYNNIHVAPRGVLLFEDTAEEK